MNISSLRKKSYVDLANKLPESFCEVPQTLNLVSIPFSHPKSCFFDNLPFTACANVMSHTWERNNVPPQHFPSLGPLLLCFNTYFIYHYIIIYKIYIMYYVIIASGERLAKHWHIAAVVPRISRQSRLLTGEATPCCTQLLLHAEGAVPLLCNLPLSYFLSTQEAIGSFTG